MKTDTDVISEESYEEEVQFGELKKLKSPRKKTMTIVDGYDEDYEDGVGFMGRALTKIQSI